MNIRAIVEVQQVNGNDLPVGEKQDLIVHSHPDRDDLVVVAASKGKQLSVIAKDLEDAIRRCS